MRLQKWFLVAVAVTTAIALAGCRGPTTPPGPAYDRAALATAITTARDLHAATVERADPAAAANVPVGTFWATPAVRGEFNTAIGAAQAVHDYAAATQYDVNRAVADLATAQATFTAARTQGTYVSIDIDREDLATAISVAQGLHAATVERADLAAAANVPVGTYWATPTVRGLFNTAIGVAQAVYEDDDATQANVDAAVTALETAQETFIEDRTEGTYVPPVVRTALADAIEEAEGLLDLTDPSPDGQGILTTRFWAPAADITAFETAIDEARDVYEDDDATQADVDAAVTALETAQETFIEDREPGTFMPRSISITFAQLTNPLEDEIEAEVTLDEIFDYDDPVYIEAPTGVTNVRWIHNTMLLHTGDTFYIYRHFPNLDNTDVEEGRRLLVTLRADSAGRTYSQIVRIVIVDD